MSWNPNAVATVGNEWRAWQLGSQNPPPIACYLNSSATETIDSLIVPYSATGTGYGKLWAEVYNAADLGAGETATDTTFYPNEDLAVSGLYWSSDSGGSWTGPISGGASNIDQYIDESTDQTYASFDAIQLRPPGMGTLSGYARLAFGTAALAAGRVLSVSVQVRYVRNGEYHNPFSVDLYNNTTLVKRLATIAPASNPGAAPSVTSFTIGPLYTNPLTEEPWTRTDIINMDTGSNLMLQLSAYGSPYTSTIVAIRLIVSMITEKRIAVGANTKTETAPSGTQTANVCTLKTPSGTDNWSKSNGTDYVVVVRSLDDPMGLLASQSFYFPYIDSGVANPHDQGHAYSATFSASGAIATATGVLTRAHGILMATTGGALSVDSQVHHNLYGAGVINGIIAKQRISSHGSTNYTTVRAVIGVNSDHVPNADLLFKIKRVSDNVQLGGTATLTPSAITEHTSLGNNDGIAWYDVQLTLASQAALVAATQYYVELSSTCTDDGSGQAYWRVRALLYTETHSFTGDQSYGGATDYATYEGNDHASDADLAVTITTGPPTAPASITVTSSNVELPFAGDETCDPGSHAVAHVSWATTAEGVLFDRYDVQRSEDGGSTWTLVARIGTESTLTFDDHEALHGVALKYRVRVVRTNGDASTWRTQSDTTTLAINTGAVVFSTNEDTTLTIGYVWLDPGHDYVFPSDAEASVVPMHGRDYQTVFHGTEDRGVILQLPLKIYVRPSGSTDRTLYPPGGKGHLAFGPLRDIVESASPYVTVHTPDGIRIFAGLRLPGGRRLEPAAYYTATVTAIEATATPVAVDV